VEQETELERACDLLVGADTTIHLVLRQLSQQLTLG
jgi:hypothetical protein